MQTEPITIDLSPRAAEAFRTASPATRRHIQDLLEYSLLNDQDLDEGAFREATEELERTLDEIGENARRRGLTDEKLESILNEPKK
jgi:hypothetical protein